MMKKVTKAVIPAAGLGTRVLPATKAMPKGMLPIVDKPAIQYLVEEAVRSGITDILIILGRNQSIIEDHFDRSPELEEKLAKPGKEKALEECLGISNMANILFVRQKQTLGLGHAVNTAKAFTGDDPFVVIYGDDVIWGEDPVCAQLIRAYEEFGRPAAGVSAVPWEDVSRYCSLKTTPIHDNYFFVDDMIEKPKKGQEFSNYSILGRVLLTPEIYDILARTKPGAGGEIQLTDAMAEFFPAEVSFTKPEGGMFLWATLPEGVSTMELFPKALERNVAFVPGDPFYPEPGARSTMRLNFTNADEETIRSGIKRLAEVIEAELA